MDLSKKSTLTKGKDDKNHVVVESPTEMDSSEKNVHTKCKDDVNHMSEKNCENPAELDLPENYTYIKVEDDGNHKVFRVKEICSESSAEVWVKEFSELSSITWRVQKTYPKCGKVNIFRKDFRCQHCTDKRAKDQTSSKNTDCPERLQVIVKRCVKYSRAKEFDENADFPGMIVMKGGHNHPVHSAGSLRYRDMSIETKDKLISLFQKGHSPSSAYHLLKMDLMVEYGENYYKVAADGYFLPTLSVVFKLFKKEFENQYGNMCGDLMFDSLNSILKDFNDNMGGKSAFHKTKDGKHYYVVLCTPIMLRCHKELSQSGELVLLDASGAMDKQRHRIYVFVTPTAAGGLPLGIIVTDAEKEVILLEALRCFKEILGEHGFNGKMFPDTFLTDNDMKERNALKEMFPNSLTLLCQFHMLKSVWSWLCKKDHNIDQSHRQELYFLFKRVLYSYDEEAAKDNISRFYNEIHRLLYPNLAAHFNHLLTYKNDWIMCFRKNLIMRGNHTTNYVEVVFRIMKDIIFERVMAYNLTQLVDFIITRYEAYLKQRLVDFSNGRYPNASLRKMLPFTDVENLKILSFTDEIFQVEEKNSVFTVDIVRGVCSCSAGSSGKICNHSSAAFLKLDDNNTAYNVANTETRRLMLRIAEGIEVDSSWFQPLKNNKASGSQNSSLSFSEDKKFDSKVEVVNAVDTVEVANVNSSSLNASNNTLTEEEVKKFNLLIDRMRNGITYNPDVFAPAIKAMLKNADNFAKTETGLVSAMYSFGRYSGKAAIRNASKNFVRRSHKTVIGVQPTAVGRRKLLSGKRRASVGRPTSVVVPQRNMADHNYTTFGNLPKRKRRATHNLDECVYSNKMLGGITKKKS